MAKVMYGVYEPKDARVYGKRGLDTQPPSTTGGVVSTGVDDSSGPSSPDESNGACGSMTMGGMFFIRQLIGYYGFNEL